MTKKLLIFLLTAFLLVWCGWEKENTEVQNQPVSDLEAWTVEGEQELQNDVVEEKEVDMASDNEVSDGNLTDEGVEEAEKKNMFWEYFESFKNDVKSLDTFTQWRDKNGEDILTIALLKMKDKELWNTFWGYKFDLYVKEGDKDFMESLSEYWETSEERKKGFSDTLNKMYMDIIEGNITEEDLWTGPDIYYYFNTFWLEKALQKCEWIFTQIGDWDKESSIKMCEDKIHFYRAAKWNGYCEKISDISIGSMCNDFLSYEITKK